MVSPIKIIWLWNCVFEHFAWRKFMCNLFLMPALKSWLGFCPVVSGFDLTSSMAVNNRYKKLAGIVFLGLAYPRYFQIALELLRVQSGRVPQKQLEFVWKKMLLVLAHIKQDASLQLWKVNHSPLLPLHGSLPSPPSLPPLCSAACPSGYFFKHLSDLAQEWSDVGRWLNYQFTVTTQTTDPVTHSYSCHGYASSPSSVSSFFNKLRVSFFKEQRSQPTDQSSARTFFACLETVGI